MPAKEDEIFFFFFPCIAERARGMVGQLSRNAKAKKGEPGITCRSLSSGLESKTKPQPNKQHQPNKHKNQRRAGENPGKKGETIRAPNVNRANGQLRGK